MGDVLDDDVRKVAERRPELVGVLELEIGPRRLHVRPLATWRLGLLASIFAP
jgi:hypothetical protein